MNARRPVRYKAPEPPRPPRPGSRPQSQMVGGDPGGSSRWMKWALVGAGAVIVALILAVISMSGSDKQAPVAAPQAEQTPEKARKPSLWSQDYSATFLYGSNVVTVDSVTVTGLRKKTASVTYLIRVRNNTGKIAWMKNRSSWAMKGVGRSAAPTRMLFSNAGKTLRLSFSWPRARLSYPGAALTMFIPGEKETERVMLGVEVPRDTEILSEREGQGGLSQ